MPLYFQGKVAFSELVPGLSSAADRLLESVPGYQKMIDDAGGGVDWLTKKVASVQAEHERIGLVLEESQEALESAQKILDEANGLLNKISNALNDSGIYHYWYVGEVGDLPTDLANHFAVNNGLPESAGTMVESIAGTLIIVGGDADLLNSANKIKRLFNQIGGNGQAIADLYRADNSLPIDPDPENPWD